ncbi:MAG: tryptophan synthase subunit alpha [Lentisphaerae bacterium]|nr:tryptophan synthase subunit alpha [Lentisphaerota bacterium]
MNRIDAAFKACRRDRRKALVAFLTAGDPDLDATAEIVPALAAAGADIIELGVPFSDPMADGPTIQESSQRALAAGTTLDGILECVRRLRRQTQVPLVLFSYYNVIFRHGLDRLAAEAAAAGVDGLLLVDVPLEELDEVRPSCRQAGLPLIRLVAPTTPPERLERICRDAEGFVYCITVTGVTGARAALPADLAAELARARAASPVPVVAGFGIASPEMARTVAAHADGVVVGSALVKCLAGPGGRAERIAAGAAFIASLAEALRPTSNA